MPPLPPPRKRMPKATTPAAAPPPPQAPPSAAAPPTTTAPPPPPAPSHPGRDALQATLDAVLDARLAAGPAYDPNTAASVAADDAAALRDACAPLLPRRAKLIAHVAVDQDDGGTWGTAARCLWEGMGADGVASAARVVRGARVSAVVLTVGVP